MAGKGASEESFDGELPAPVREWLARIAADRGLSEAELLRQLIPEGEHDRPGQGPHESAERLDALAAELDDAKEQVGEVESAIDEARVDFAEKIDDVRERVIQLKRETDGKAPADHEHPEVDDELASLRADLDAIFDELGELESTVDAVDDRVRSGFRNFEQVVRHLDETTDGLNETVDRLRKGVNDLHGRLRTIEASSIERANLAELLSSANRHGAGTADCGSCERTVRLGLLTAPRCPHCESGFTDFDPKQGFFGSHTLETGEIPALTGEVTQAEGPVSNIVEAEETSDTATDSPAGSGDDVASDKPSFDAFEEISTSDSLAGDATDVDVESDGSIDESGRRDDPEATNRAVGSDEPDETSHADADDESETRVVDTEDPDDGTPLQAVDGVGPAFAERLQNAGVASVEELVRADAEVLATEVDVSAVRTERWIERGTGLVEGE